MMTFNREQLYRLAMAAGADEANRRKIVLRSSPKYGDYSVGQIV